jgi:hypothetical protein
VNSESIFNLMRENFARAAARSPYGVSCLYYILAGELVQFRIVGQKLARLLRLPFAHLEKGRAIGEVAHLTIELWDQAETGFDGSEPGSWMTYPLVHDRYAAYRFHGTCVHFDRISRHMIGSVANAETLSLYERGRPLHPPLARWLNDRRVPLIHAGLVSKAGKGVLLAGAGGSGKSTTAITCLEAGYQYLSDDLLGLQILPDGSAIGHSLYNSTYLEVSHLSRFSKLGCHAVKNGDNAEDKLLVLFSEIFPTRLERAANINVIVLPRVSHQSQSTFSLAPKSKALFALAPSSRNVNKGLGVADFEALVQLVERVPCYWLDLAEDLEEIPRCVDKLLGAVN